MDSTRTMAVGAIVKGGGKGDHRGGAERWSRIGYRGNPVAPRSRSPLAAGGSWHPYPGRRPKGTACCRHRVRPCAALASAGQERCRRPCYM